MELPSKEEFVPAEREEEGSFFLTKEELQEALDGDPEQLGFTKCRARIEGEQRRGFWVRKS